MVGVVIAGREVTDQEAGTRIPGAETRPYTVEVERSLTIGLPAEALYRLWLEPQTLRQVMAHFADVSTPREGHARWHLHLPTGRAPGGRTFEWETQVTEQRPGELVRWATTEGAVPNEGAVRFRPAPHGDGTIATLCIRFAPPGGRLGDFALKIGKRVLLLTVVEKALRRFKALAETGEIPTTEHQPAGRRGGRGE